MRRIAARWLPVVASVAILTIAWQGATDLLGVPTYLLPSPSAIAAGAADGGTTLAWGLLTTMTETVAGFGIGAAVGLALAVAFVLLPALGAAAMPMIVAINAVPSVAFVPLALIWFGIGMASKVAMAALAVSFPVLVSTLAGLRRPEEAAVSLLRSFGAGRFGVLWRLRLPAAMPSLVTGLRVGLARGTIVVIVTEMLGAYAGVGQIIYQATAQVDAVTVWAAVLAASASSLVLYGILVAVDRRLVWW
ncbi:ABC transporter permease [uncultured Methylobacterium sp.]|uniref:ABC transporter permease n=1 Tax=uncultured Methylobacterium sp. TaxID=157278 RepID=UPI0035C9ED40